MTTETRTPDGSSVALEAQSTASLSTAQAAIAEFTEAVTLIQEAVASIDDHVNTAKSDVDKYVTLAKVGIDEHVKASKVAIDQHAASAVSRAIQAVRGLQDLLDSFLASFRRGG